MVSVIGPKGRQVNIGYKEHAIRLDEKATVSAGVAGKVHNFDTEAASKVEVVSVGESCGVKSRFVVELLDHLRTPLCRYFCGHAIDLQVSLQAVKRQKVIMVGVDMGIGKRGYACGVVFVCV